MIRRSLVSFYTRDMVTLSGENSQGLNFQGPILWMQKLGNVAAERFLRFEATEITWLKTVMTMGLLWQVKSTVMSAAWVWFRQGYEAQKKVPSSFSVTMHIGIRLINRRFPFFQHVEIIIIIIPEGYDLLLRYFYTFISRPIWKELKGRLYSSNTVVKAWTLLQAPE